MNKINLIELYTCLQGEGKFMGVPHILVRFGGCNFRCDFGAYGLCDTPQSSYSFNVKEAIFDYQDVFNMVKENIGIKHILITGGEPTLSKGFSDFVRQLRSDFPFHVLSVETNGSILIPTDTASYLDCITISPKFEYAFKKDAEERMAAYRDSLYKNVKTSGDKLIFKLVVVKNTDFDKQLTLLEDLEVSNHLVYLMPAGTTDELMHENRQIAWETALKYCFNYSDRLHIVVYKDKPKIKLI